MKIFYISICICLLLHACTSKEYKRDRSIGIEYLEDGLNCHDVSMTIDGHTAYRREFVYKEQVTFHFNEISGFAVNDEKVFPIMELFTLAENQDTIMHVVNTLDETFSGFPADSILMVSQRIPTYPPGKYKTYFTVRDAHSDAVYSAVLNYTIKTFPDIEITTNHASCAGAALTEDSLGIVIADNIVDRDQQVNLRIYDIKNFTIENETAFPVVRFELKNGSGEIVGQSDNVFEHYKDTGIDISNLDEMQIFFKTGGPTLKNPLQYTCVITDQKSDAKIIVKGKFSVR